MSLTTRIGEVLIEVGSAIVARDAAAGEFFAKVQAVESGEFERFAETQKLLGLERAGEFYDEPLPTFASRQPQAFGDTSRTSDMGGG